MPDTGVANFTDGLTANATDRIAAIRTPFGAGDDRYLTPAYIKTYMNGLANTWSANGVVSAPSVALSGTWFSGGSSTTTKPQFLLEPTGTTSTGWSTSGTGLGVNAASGFTGNLIDVQTAGVSRLSVSGTGLITSAGSGSALYLNSGSATGQIALNFNNPGELTISALGTLSYGSSGINSADTFLRRGGAAATLQQGGIDVDTNASIVSQVFRSQGALTGGTANQAGKDWTFLASPGKGTGAGGSFIFKVAPAGASGSTQNTAVAGLTIASTLLSTFGGAVSFGSPVTKTGDFTLADTENHIINNRGATNTATLPAASAWPGRMVYMKTIQAQAVVSAGSDVVPSTSATAGTAILPATDGAWALLVSDGTNWVIMAANPLV